MQNDKFNANKSIECGVTQCANHCKTENYCALNRIKVDTNETNPQKCECTNCSSFVPDDCFCDDCHCDDENK